MIKKSKKGRVILIISVVFSMLTALLNIVASMLLAFNFNGVGDVVTETMRSVNTLFMSTDVSLICIEMLIIAMIDVFAGIRYIAIIKYGINPRRGGNYLFQPIIQMLCGSFLGGLLALIGIVRMTKDQIEKMQHPISPEEAMNDCKQEAMIHAVTRLKELKSRGAISEEEYYETLNKILES